MTSAFLPELFPAASGAVVVVTDPAMQETLRPLIKRLGEQRSSRFGFLVHSEWELVLVRLDRLANAPGFEDLHKPELEGWRVFYHPTERRLDSVAYRPISGGKEVWLIPVELR